MDEHAKIPRALVDDLFELGVMGIEIPRATAGRRETSSTPCSPSKSCPESTRRRCPGGRPEHAGDQCAAALGQRRIKRRYLRDSRLSVVGAYALSEAGSGSDAFALTTRARKDRDGFVLNGRKLWITNGNEADLFIVFATINSAAGYRGITAFLVERGFAGFTVGKKEDKLGIRASSTCELILEDCRVPEANILGEVGKGYKTAIETLNEGRIGIGAQMVGLAKGALQHAIAYTKERKQFGKAIAEFQAVQHQLARRPSRSRRPR